MDHRNIVVGQFVEDGKLDAARRLRRQATPAERLLWHSLRGRGLAGFKFRRQQVIDGFIVDFYCPTAGIVVELDGSSHDGKEDADRDREKILATRNVRILRFANEYVENDLASVLRSILKACDDLAPQPPFQNGEGE